MPLDVNVGGQTAPFVDQGEVTAKRLALFVGSVAFLSFVLLLAVFRAPAVALSPFRGSARSTSPAEPRAPRSSRASRGRHR